MNKIDTLRQRFIIGNDSPLQPNTCPSDWQPLLTGQAPENTALTALAILSHYQALAEIPQPPANLTPKPILPPLSLPSLPEKFHHELRAMSNWDVSTYIALLGLLESRGYSLPPQFWRPSMTKKDFNLLPATYLPWLLYGTEKEVINDPITAENWADFFPAARLEALETLRVHDPAAFRGLVESCLSQEKAAHRLAIVKLFLLNLSPADKPFLESLQQERAKKVAELATDLLQLLDPKSNEKKAEEIKKYFEKGINQKNKKPYIALKTNVNKKALLDFLERVDIQLIAESLELPVADLALTLDLSWQGIEIFHLLVRKTLPCLEGQDLLRFQQRYLSSLLKKNYYFSTTPFVSALDTETQEVLLLERLQNKKGLSGWTNIAYFHHRPFPANATELFLKIPKRRDDYSICFFGFLLPSKAAAAYLEDFEKKGENVHFAPKFAPLRLNAALPEK